MYANVLRLMLLGTEVYVFLCLTGMIVSIACSVIVGALGVANVVGMVDTFCLSGIYSAAFVCSFSKNRGLNRFAARCACVFLVSIGIPVRVVAWDWLGPVVTM